MERRPSLLAALLVVLAAPAGRAASPGPNPPRPPIVSFLLLDLDGGGLDLTDRSYGVCFDVDGDGRPERVNWTAGGGEEAFLWRDEDGDGRVDGGGELLAGFDALMLLDRAGAGGDEDGLLDAADRVFGDLALWIDRDHDGIADRGEVRPLVAAVAAIDLDPRVAGELDGHLNLHRRAGRFRAATGSRPVEGIVREVVLRVAGGC